MWKGEQQQWCRNGVVVDSSMDACGTGPLLATGQGSSHPTCMLGIMTLAASVQHAGRSSRRNDLRARRFTQAPLQMCTPTIRPLADLALVLCIPDTKFLLKIPAVQREHVARKGHH